MMKPLTWMDRICTGTRAMEEAVVVAVQHRQQSIVLLTTCHKYR